MAVIIGTSGKTKRRIERLARVKLRIGDEEVEMRGKDPYDEFRAKDVIRAIARGFSPDDALTLLQEEHYLKLIDLKELFGSEKAIARNKARIIGERGRTKKVIEECSGARLSIYGNTVGIIGTLDEVRLAAEAVERLLEGKSHSFVYAMLERGRKRMKEERMLGMWEKKE